MMQHTDFRDLWLGHEALASIRLFLYLIIELFRYDFAYYLESVLFQQCESVVNTHLTFLPCAECPFSLVPRRGPCQPA